MEDRKKRVQWIYSSQDNKELAERYDVWAKDYDSDLDEAFGWQGPQRAVDFFVSHVPDKEAKILDAGAGTGLVGVLLARQGYKNMVAMDISQGMLDEARKKGVYQGFDKMVMGEHLGYETNSFDAVISVGVLTVGHAPASSLDELIRVTKPGGHIVFSLRPDVYRDSGFKEKQDALESEGKWKLVEASEEFQPLPKGEPEVYHQVWIYQVV
jgi:ubiquinone/menaquinone biosynthesis C-methylase UbiE